MLNAVYKQADDELSSGIGEVSNDAFYIQGFYNFLSEGRAFITPIAHYDVY